MALGSLILTRGRLWADSSLMGFLAILAIGGGVMLLLAIAGIAMRLAGFNGRTRSRGYDEGWL